MRAILMVLILGLVLAYGNGCEDDAYVANKNMTKAADNFEIPRRIVFFNGITDQYLLTIEGYCSLKDQGNQLEVLIRTGPEQYKKHFLGLSDNVSYFAEQLSPANISVNHYRVTFKPQSIIPHANIRGNVEELTESPISVDKAE